MVRKMEIAVPHTFPDGETVLSPEELLRVALLRLAGCVCPFPLLGHSGGSLRDGPRCRLCNTSVVIKDGGREVYQYGIRAPSGLILLYTEEGEALRAQRDMGEPVTLLRRKITYGDWEDKMGEGWHWSRENWRKPHAF